MIPLLGSAPALPNIKLLIVFAHNKEPDPWGSKICRLADIGKRNGDKVISPDYADLHILEADHALHSSLDRLEDIFLPFWMLISKIARCELLTRGVLVAADEIEALMRG